MSTEGFFAIVAIVMFGMNRFLVWLNKDSYENAVQTTGRIERIKTTDSGNIIYEVLFEQEGISIVGSSKTYSSTKGKYNPGDTVLIKYFITSKGNARVKVVDDELEDCSGSANLAAKRVLIVSIAAATLAVIFFIKNIIL